MPSRRTRILAAATAAVAVASTVDVALAAFSAQTSNAGNTFTAATDFRAPVVSAVAMGKAAGGTPGFVKQGDGYHVYANVAPDTGNPASGIASVRADASTLTTGAAAVALTAGSYSVNGTPYGYRSALQTANASLAEGSRNFTVTATDAAANAGSLSGTATVDNTAPLAADVQTTNVGGGTASLAEQGDTLRLTFSEPLDPQSIQAGWDGGATNVVVRLVDGALLGLGADAVQVYDAANSTALPLGQVQLGRSDYIAVGLSGNVRFGASGAPSTMAFAGNVLVLTLGTYNATVLVDPSRTTAGGTGTMVWNPVATPYDRAQNLLSTAAATESGALDRDF